MRYKLALTGKVLLNFDSSSNYMHKDLLANCSSCFSDILHLFSSRQGKHFGWFFKTNISLLEQGQCQHAPAPMLTSEFHLNLKAHQPHLISLVLAVKSQCQTALPAGKAIAQTEPKGNKTEPVENC